MPQIRIAAIVLLLLAVPVALWSIYPYGTLFLLDSWSSAAETALAAANAAGVLWLAQRRTASWLGVTGLWMVLAAAVSLMLLATIALWFDLAAPPQEGYLASPPRIGFAILASLSLTGTSLTMLALGWGSWIADRMRARRMPA